MTSDAEQETTKRRVKAGQCDGVAVDDRIAGGKASHAFGVLPSREAMRAYEARRFSSTTAPRRYANTQDYAYIARDHERQQVRDRQ